MFFILRLRFNDDAAIASDSAQKSCSFVHIYNRFFGFGGSRGLIFFEKSSFLLIVRFDTS